ncbi:MULTISPECIES: DUF2530 domain-containing protein [unclassified Streptomyces]|uniref:DUF2530 domain-containing protein n=1 Tax=unclassified Streptomyces TaxID=2593676 RepID=UPI002E783557|nr:DUF2530 domain-containing protein [Streptomyces sp. JV176]MEE1800565.1 DUF2530 domain-containing protein [Streptomyces sp. JV176]
MTGSTPQRAAPEPLEGPVVGTVTGGTIIWFALFLLQLPFYGWYSEHGHTWWIWTCLAGAGLGLIGIWYVRGRDAALKRAAAAAEADAEGTSGPDEGRRDEDGPGTSGP